MSSKGGISQILHSTQPSFLKKCRPLISASKIDLRNIPGGIMLQVDVKMKKEKEKKDMSFFSHICEVTFSNRKACVEEMEDDIIEQEIKMHIKTGWFVEKMVHAKFHMTEYEDVPLFLCSNCSLEVPKVMFSKTQRALGSTKRQCVVCVEQKNTPKKKKKEKEEEEETPSLRLLTPSDESDRPSCAVIIDDHEETCYSGDCRSMHTFFCLCGKIHFISKELNDSLRWYMNSLADMEGEDSVCHSTGDVNLVYQNLFQRYQECPEKENKEQKSHRQFIKVRMVEALNSFKNGFVDLFNGEDSEKRMNYIRYTLCISQPLEILMLTLYTIKEYATLKEEAEEPGNIVDLPCNAKEFFRKSFRLPASNPALLQ
jgi:hypothetical protein